MKGCLVAFAVFVIFLIVLGVGCGGYMAFKGQKLIAEIDQELTQLYETNDRWPFVAPEDALLPAPELKTYLEVRDQAQLPITEFLNTIVRLDKEGDEMGTLEVIKTAFGLAGKAMGAFRDVPKLLNSSLSAQEMSIDEYVWICETIHLTLAKAERDGNPEAADVVAGLEERNDKINIDVKDEKVSYRNLRRALERRKDAWLPENLKLILENEDAICASQARILLDAIVVQSLHSSDHDSGDNSDSGESGK